MHFFKNLHIETVISPETNKDIIRKGVSNSIDEACFSSQIFIGHVEYLLDKCDMIFVLRVENAGIREEYCTRIFGLYDLVRNTFPDANILHADVNYLYRKKESMAFIEIGEALGKSKEEAQEAYKKALAAADSIKAENIAAQQELLQHNGPKVLIFSHAYNSFDASIGKEVASFFHKNNIRVAYADLIDAKEARSITRKTHGNRICWKVTTELLGGVERYKDFVDGIILISTFPCGPDSLFNELLLRTIKDKPILSLVFDAQDASAGIQTRLESFVDIVMARREVLS